MPSNRMPGFTAEAAEYVSGTSYRSPTGTSGSAVGSGVSASLVAPPDKGCIPGCICVTPEGCPCCESIFKVGRPLAAMRANAGANAGAPSSADQFYDWCAGAGGGAFERSDGTWWCIF